MIKQYRYDFPHPAVCADSVVFAFDGRLLRVLLIKRGKQIKNPRKAFAGYWALPGCFLDPEADKTAEEAAIRGLFEETGLILNSLEQFKTYSQADRDPRERVISVAHYGTVKWADAQGVEPDSDASKAEWIAVNSVPVLAFDHIEVFHDALASLVRDSYFKPLLFDLLPDVFTIPQLKNLYEDLLGKKLDRRNMAVKLLRPGLIEVAEERPEGTARRIPVKYRFNRENYEKFRSEGNLLEL